MTSVKKDSLPVDADREPQNQCASEVPTTHDTITSIPQNSAFVPYPHKPSVNLFAEVRSRVPIADLFERHGIEIKRGYALCPFHGERTASLKLYTEQNTWHCFGCGAGGTVIDFVARMYSCTALDAAKRLNEMYALGIPPSGKLTHAERVRMARESEARERKRAADESLREWEAAAYVAVSTYFRFLTAKKRQREESDNPKTDDYARELASIGAIENLVDMMIEQVDNMDKIKEFYSAYREAVERIEQRVQQGDVADSGY